jgi:hypothetical protein
VVADQYGKWAWSFVLLPSFFFTFLFIKGEVKEKRGRISMDNDYDIQRVNLLFFILKESIVSFCFTSNVPYDEGRNITCFRIHFITMEKEQIE